MTDLSPSATDTRTAMLAYVDAIKRGDREALAATFHPDATWSLPGDLPVSRTWVGRDAILGEFLPAVVARFVPDSFELDVHAVVVDGDNAVLEWTVRAKTPEGEDYKNDYMAIFVYEAGRIVEVREYMDTGVMARVLFPSAA